MLDKVIGCAILLTFLSVIGVGFYARPDVMAVFLPMVVASAGVLAACIWAMGVYDA